MSVHVIGKCLGVTEATRGKPGSEFQVKTIHVLDGVHTLQLDVAREFRGVLPVEGEHVVLDAYVSAWKSQAGNVGVQYKAAGRSQEIESLLFEPASR